MLRRLLRALVERTLGPYDGEAGPEFDTWAPEHDQPIDLVPAVALPAGLLPQPGTTRVAYDPTSGALVRIPDGARTTDDAVVVVDPDSFDPLDPERYHR